jgi:oligogalacturonide lyase
MKKAAFLLWLLGGVAAVVSGCVSQGREGVWPPSRDGGLEWVDRSTGHRVIRLSRREGVNEVFYFHQNPFTASGDRMVFMGGTEQGRCAFTVDLKTLELSRITDGNTGFEVVAPKNRTLYYMSGDRVLSTHLDTLETREIAQLAGHHAQGRGLSVNADETLLAGCYCRGEETLRRPDKTRREWIRDVWAARLPNALYTVDIADGTVREPYRVNEWLGHVQFSPTDPGLILFCHEGPGWEVERLWMIRADGTGLRQLHRKGPTRELQTHEFWAPDGKKAWCDFQEQRLPAWTSPALDALTTPRYYLASFNVESGELRKYPYPMRYASRHFNISPDQTLFCGDGEGGSFRPGPSGKWVFLYTMENGRVRVRRLCSMKGHSWSSYPEPNTHFTPDGKWVVFQSDVSGTTQVYAVEVEPRP